MQRYPFPIPFGWFQVAYPAEVPPGTVLPRYYFGRDLVLWRDEDGELHLQDAFCPHLGAHLGHGGRVEGRELECPFHGWRFDGDGRNTCIPYSSRTNARARIRSYPVIERNGLVMAWYHPHDEPPAWDIPAVPECTSDEFSDMVTRDYTIAAAWQEMAENGVDSAHFRYVHSTDTVPEVERYETDGPRSIMRSAQKFVTPRGVVDARIDVDTHGPGFAVTRFSGIVDTTLIGCNTPIDDRHCHLRFNFMVRKLGDEATTSSVGDAFVAEIDRQVIEDRPIWEHKAYLPRPALADTDGPFMAFRRWASQFYAEPVAEGRECWEPPAPDPSAGQPVFVRGEGTRARQLAERRAAGGT